MGIKIYYTETNCTFQISPEISLKSLTWSHKELKKYLGQPLMRKVLLRVVFVIRDTDFNDVQCDET